MDAVLFPLIVGAVLSAILLAYYFEHMDEDDF
jgi:hypothetical protein